MGKIHKLQVSNAAWVARARAKKALMSHGRVDLEKLLGESIQTVYQAAHEPDETFTYCGSIVAYTKDNACDPSSGAVMGKKNLAAFYGVSPEYYGRVILPACHDWVRYYFGKPVSHVNSVFAHALQHTTNNLQTWLDNLGIEKKTTNTNSTNVSSGYWYGVKN